MKKTSFFFIILFFCFKSWSQPEENKPTLTQTLDFIKNEWPAFSKILGFQAYKYEREHYTSYISSFGNARKAGPDNWQLGYTNYTTNQPMNSDETDRKHFDYYFSLKNIESISGVTLGNDPSSVGYESYLAGFKFKAFNGERLITESIDGRSEKMVSEFTIYLWRYDDITGLRFEDIKLYKALNYARKLVGAKSPLNFD